MAAPMNAPLAPFLTLSDGMTVRLTALDAATGSVVSGVTIANVSIDVDPSSVTDSETAPDVVRGAYTSGGDG